MENTENKQTSSETAITNQQLIVEKEFELAIYDVSCGDSGKEEYRQVPFTEPVTVTARSPTELKNKLDIFKQCGQIAKVTRIIGEKTIQPDGSANSVKPIVQPTQTIQPTYSQSIIAPPTVIQNSETQKTKPRYFKVGDIEVKDDNGKIYQKQWMKLSETEASNIRVINDKNNSLVNLNGKHFEMKKWVLVENTNESDDLTNLEENLINE